MIRLLLSLSFLALPAAARSPLHTWTDKDGVLHVDDTPPPGRARSPRKTTPSSYAAGSPKRTGSWWEKRSDAPPDEIDRAAALHNIPSELVRAVIWA